MLVIKSARSVRSLVAGGGWLVEACWEACWEGFTVDVVGLGWWVGGWLMEACWEVGWWRLAGRGSSIQGDAGR